MTETIMNQNKEICTESYFTAFVEWIDRGERTTKSYLANLKLFARWLRENEIAEPCRADILRYRNEMAARHSANTCNAYLTPVKLFFSWTAANGLYPNICENVHGQKVDTMKRNRDAFRPEQIAQIEKKIIDDGTNRAEQAAEAVKDAKGKAQRNEETTARLCAMLNLAACLGLRCCELSRANIADVQTRNGRPVLMIYGKGRSCADQPKPIPAPVYDLLVQYLNTRTDDKTPAAPLFVSTSNRSKGQRMDPRTISSQLKTAMKNAGYDTPALSAHSLRHFCGTETMKQTGNDLYATKEFLRHSKAETTTVYLHGQTMDREASIAEGLYNAIHSAETEAEPAETSTVELLLTIMTPEQRAQLQRLLCA